MAGPRRNTHGTAVRGLSLPRQSNVFGGQFGRLFPVLPPADFGESDTETEINLLKLGTAMVAAAEDPEDGPDPEESGIPAAYTYLGQFVDHDLTFDPASSLQQQSDPEGLIDFRTPRFDLDCIYGKGPDDAPYLYTRDGRFLQGRPLTGAANNPDARDLPRSQPTDPAQPEDMDNPRRAIIGDPRNDENVIVSQLQGLFHRFHNLLMREDMDAGRPGRGRFERVQQEARFHYQWMLVNDFLPRIIWRSVLEQIIPHHFANSDVTRHPPKLLYYNPRREPIMPLEFAAAAYRFGHSMVRAGYRLNEHVPTLPIFSDDPSRSLLGFHEFRSNWAFDWRMFVDLEDMDAGDEAMPDNPGNKNRLQLAYLMDTSLVDPLGHLPKKGFDPPLSGGGTSLVSLAARNLLRGWRMRLPSGQTVARAMGVTPLQDDAILIGKFTGEDDAIEGKITDFGAAFAGNCPLWTYVLAETKEVEHQVSTKQGMRTLKSRVLGEVGGRIVAETFIGLMLADPTSYFNQDPIWRPSKAGADGRFRLADFVRAALSEPAL
jgi:hypothetical protein